MSSNADARSDDPLPSLRLEGVTRTFDAVRAVEDVSFEIAGFGAVGVIGPNGSGKSTLLALLSGLLKPTSGDVFVDARKVTGKGPQAFARFGVARTFQHSRLVPTLRVWENIVAGRSRVGNEYDGNRHRLRRWRRLGRADAASVFEVADQFGLSSVLDSWPDELPNAFQRKAEVARAVFAKPRILLLDEPAAGLSGHEAAQLAAILQTIAETTLVVIVEHNMQVIYDLASRVLVMLHGRLEVDGTPAGVAESQVVRTEYLGVA